MKYLFGISIIYFISSCSGSELYCNFPEQRNICKSLVAIDPGDGHVPNFGEDILIDNKRDVVPRKINEIRNIIAGGSMELNFSNGMHTMKSSASMTAVQWEENLAYACFGFTSGCTVIKFYDCVGLEILTTNNTIHNVTFVSYEYEDSSQIIDEAIWKAFEHGAQYFEYSDMETYSKNEEAEFFTMIARHDSLFVGCMTTVEVEEPFKKLLVCAFTPAWNAESNNILYFEGNSCSECPFDGYNCSEQYPNLCGQPPHTLFDDQVQNSTYVEGFTKDPRIPSNYTNFGSFGWLKVNEDKGVNWEEARNMCIREGADHYTPGTIAPIVPLELHLYSQYEYWMGVRRGSDLESPFERVAAHDASVLPDNSTLWHTGDINQPIREDGLECVYYYSMDKRLYVKDCTYTFYFICQIIV